MPHGVVSPDATTPVTRADGAGGADGGATLALADVVADGVALTDGVALGDGAGPLDDEQPATRPAAATSATTARARGVTAKTR